jgi:hypothetical protein
LGTGLSAIRKTNKCNIECKFCYNYGELDDISPIGEGMWEIGGTKFYEKDIDLLLSIYQKPIIVKETVADFDYASGAKTNFFPRVWDSVVQGWGILAEVVIFLVKIWGIVLLILALVFGINYVSKWMKKKN